MKNRISSIVLTLLLLDVGAARLSSSDGQPSDWSRMPLATRKQLHLYVNQVPPYPEDDRRLMKVGLWPKTRVFDGKKYVQEFSASSYDMVRFNLRSLSEIDSGWSYGSHYAAYSRDGKRRSTRGPSYYWYSDSAVKERNFLAPSSRQSWFYDRKGNLRVYVVSMKGSGCEPGMSSTETFGTDGALVICQLGRPPKYYWMGEELSWEEYDRLRNKLWKWE